MSASERSHALFATTLGSIGVAWSEAGLVGVQLPEVTPEQTEARLVARARSQPAKAPAWVLDEERTRAMILWLKARPEVTRIFIEPHLADRLGVGGGKVRFQGCRAARHDDHLHVEIR